MIQAIGWISTALVLAGYITNAKGYTKWAMLTWIVGDIGWITYDVYIRNYSHLALSGVIIVINLYGIYRLWKNSSIKKTLLHG
jgi:hypothetical protein